MTRGILLLAYGAPNSLADVEPFYTDIRRGRKPSPEQLEDLLARYRTIGGGSPLLGITQRQAAALDARLGAGYRTVIGMRHWTPWIREAVAELARDGIREAVAIVLAPHYSKLSIAKYMELVDAAAAEQGAAMRIRKVLHWHTAPAYLDALAQRVRDAQDRFPATGRSPHVLFTAHSLPERIRAEGDPYPAQLQETAHLLATRLGLETGRWDVAYQSAGRTPEPWLGPDILERLNQLAAAGERRVLVCVIGFVADHLEVLYDLDVEARAAAGRLGIHLERIEMLNDDPALVDALAGSVLAAFQEPGGESPST